MRTCLQALIISPISKFFAYPTLHRAFAPMSTALSLYRSEYLRSISLPVPVVVEDTSSSSEYGSVSPDNDLNSNPFIFKPSVKCYSERDVKGPRSLFLR